MSTYVHTPTLRAWTAANDRARDTYYADSAVRAGLCGICGDRKCSSPTTRTCGTCRNRRTREKK